MHKEYIKTEAIVISREDLRSSSLKLHVHTSEEGRRFLQAKGFYKNKSQRDTMLSVGTVLELVYMLRRGSETAIIKEMNIITVPDIQEALLLTVIHHFVEFLKIKEWRETTKRAPSPKSIYHELKALEMSSLVHLEEEFANYKEQYPR